MSKVAYQPLTVLVRAHSSDSRPSSNSAKVLRAAATLVAVFSLFGAVAICSIGFRAFTPGPLGQKGSSGPPVFSATKASPATPADQDSDTGLLLTDPNQAHQWTAAPDHSTIDRTPLPSANPTLPTVPTAKPELPAGDSALLEQERPAATQKSPERELPKSVRRNLEKDRRQAERKRSRLEEMYQKHAISSDAYKLGEEKYKSEIERYRREMNAGREPKNEPDF
jgi:hypothetical protein